MMRLASFEAVILASSMVSLMNEAASLLASAFMFSIRMFLASSELMPEICSRRAFCSRII